MIRLIPEMPLYFPPCKKCPDGHPCKCIDWTFWICLAIWIICFPGTWVFIWVVLPRINK